MKGNTSNKVRLKCPCKSLWGVQYYFVMGRHIFVIEKKVLQNFLLWPNYYFFLLAAQVLLKIIVSVEPCLASVVVWEAALVRMSMRLGRKKITVYSLQKTRLHHCIYIYTHTYIHTHTHTHTHTQTYAIEGFIHLHFRWFIKMYSLDLEYGKSKVWYIVCMFIWGKKALSEHFSAKDTP